MNILVTGATGFIGNHAVKRLLQESESKLNVTATSISEDELTGLDWRNQVNYISYDLYQSEDFSSIFEIPDILIHLTWKGLPNYKANFHFEENVFFEYNFLKGMIERGVKKVVVAGTCFEYGLQEGCLSEEQETKPYTNYGFAKDMLRKMLERLVAEKSEVSLCWARLFYMYGEGQNENSFISLLKRAIRNGDEIFQMSKGEQLRDFLPVEQVADKIVRLALLKKAKGIFNICSGKPTSLRTLAERIIYKEKSKIKLNLGYYPYPNYEPMAFWGDSKKYNNLIKNSNE